MKINVLATAAALSDQDLLARLSELAGRERETSVELVAHLAELEARPAVYAAQGYGSLYGYCTQALRLSEDAACNRIETARAWRRFPVLLDLLASGEMSLTSVRLLGRYLTPENHQSVLQRAMRRTRKEIDALVAELDPRPDARSSVRRLPTCTPPPRVPQTDTSVAMTASSDSAPTIATPPPTLVAAPRPVVQATAPQRYRVQFTIGEEAHDKLRRLQALLRREIPDGDPGKIFERAATLLLEKVERTKLGGTSKPRPAKPRPQPIRPGTDKQIDERALPSRHIPNDVKRAVYSSSGLTALRSCVSARVLGRSVRTGQDRCSLTHRPSGRARDSAAKLQPLCRLAGFGRAKCEPRAVRSRSPSRTITKNKEAVRRTDDLLRGSSLLLYVVVRRTSFGPLRAPMKAKGPSSILEGPSVRSRAGLDF